MSWNVVRLGDAQPQPWRNGGGVTRELFAWPAALQSSDTRSLWTVRMSVAEVASDGPFSAFPGVERWFAVLAGEGVALRIAGELHEVRVGGQPLCFDGGLPVDCKLIAGPTQDFNLMTRGRTARMQRVTGRSAMKCSARSVVALYASSPSRLRTGHEEFHVPSHALSWQAMTEATTVEVESDDALWMEIGV